MDQMKSFIILPVFFSEQKHGHLSTERQQSLDQRKDLLSNRRKTAKVKRKKNEEPKKSQLVILQITINEYNE